MKFLVTFLIYFNCIEAITYVPPSRDVGLFSTVMEVLGLADYYEKTGKGFRVNYHREGLYYCPRLEDNWWENYFEPISERCDDEIVFEKSTYEKAFKGPQSTWSRKKAHEVLTKHVRVRNEILEKVNAFTKEHFQGRVLGVHFRETDKVFFSIAESDYVSHDELFYHIDREWAGGKYQKIFVATDSEEAFQALEARYGGQVISYATMRSLTKEALHYKKDSSDPYYSYKQGEEALIDCLLLSKCDFLIKTASNLSLVSAFFNPDLPVYEITSQYVPLNKR